MERSDFTSDRAGRPVRVQDYWAFIPAPLAPELRWTDSLIGALSDADQAIGTLAGIAHTVENPHLLINPFIRKEAHLSSRIEGTQSSLSDLILFEASPAIAVDKPDVREVANYVHALTHGLERHEKLPMSLRLIRELHQVLMRDVRGGQARPGEFRKNQNWIGSPGRTANEARFVPPPLPQMNEALNHFEKFLHAKTALPALVRFALIHYQFEAIHPFLDGNGRIGRLLISLLLCIEKILSEPLLYLSAYFEKHREQYYDHLLEVSLAGRWEEWIIFFLRGISEQSRDAARRSRQLFQLRREFGDRVHQARRSVLLHKLIDHLFAYPAITVRETARLLSVTPRSADGNIQRLVDAGILREITGRGRNRVYVAEEIIHVLQVPEAAG